VINPRTEIIPNSFQNLMSSILQAEIEHEINILFKCNNFPQTEDKYVQRTYSVKTLHYMQ